VIITSLYSDYFNLYAKDGSTCNLIIFPEDSNMRGKVQIKHLLYIRRTDNAVMSLKPN